MSDLLAKLNDEQRTVAINKVAQFAAQGMPLQQISTVIGLPTDFILALQALETYKDVFARMRAEEEEKVATLSDAWDRAEAKSLEIVNNHLATTPDAEFAATFALKANKATRRGQGEVPGGRGGGGLSIAPGKNSTIHITLQSNYVENLQENNSFTISKECKQARQHVVNVLPPRAVEELLKDEEYLEAEVCDALRVD